jgi:hypothetical protein
MFRGQEIWEGITDKDIEAMYQRLMSPSDNMFEMSSFFTIVHIRAIEDMVHEDTVLFQKNWEQIDEEQKETSLLDT